MGEPNILETLGIMKTFVILLLFIEISCVLSRAEDQTTSRIQFNENTAEETADYRPLSSDDGWYFFYKGQFQSETRKIADEHRWSDWSYWSDCSRPCGGGTAFQRRRCLPQFDCQGEAIKYKSCNIEPCPEGTPDFRLEQCSAYDDEFNAWVPKKYPPGKGTCSLKCQQVKGGNAIVELAPKVLDGTKCLANARDMCINGKCVPVGCDYQLYSDAKEDICGVCNGDGNSCKEVKGHFPIPTTGLDEGEILDLTFIPEGSTNIVLRDKSNSYIALRGLFLENGINQFMDQLTESGVHNIEGTFVEYTRYKNHRELLNIKGPTSTDLTLSVLLERPKEGEKIHYHYYKPLKFVWKYQDWTPCSKTCGQGIKESHVQCIEFATNQTVDDKSCDTEKPAVITEECNLENCPARWLTNPWQECSRTCGHGWQERSVYCVEELGSLLLRVNDSLCPGLKPPASQACNTFLCPSWHPQKWSQCSATCWRGIKTRTVDCFDHEGKHSTNCDPVLKPAEKRGCLVGIPCIRDRDKLPLSDSGGPGSDLFQAHELQQYTLVKTSEDGKQTLSSTGTQSIQSVSDKPSYVVNNWGPCSVSCGEGIQIGQVQCMVLLSFSGQVETLDDLSCRNVSKPPPNTRLCAMPPCIRPLPDYDQVGDDTVSSQEIEGVYIWDYSGYGECSSTCQGGIQESIISCFDIYANEYVSDSLCSGQELLPLLPRDCNSGVQCSEGAEWQVEDWSECTKSCGTGYQVRKVVCSQRVLAGDTVSIDQVMCQREKPADYRACNQIDCPPFWLPREWLTCLTECGEGLQLRQVTCNQMKSYGVIEKITRNNCPEWERPNEMQPCFLEDVPCPPAVLILANYSTFDQHEPLKKIRLTVGMQANLLEGTTLTISCPVQRTEKKSNWKKHHITWLKDGLKISPFHYKMKVFRGGVLRIKYLESTDAGTYTCEAATSREDFNLNVRENKLTERKIRWKSGGWSSCSAECGKGVRIRESNCQVIEGGVMERMPPSICLQNGLEQPNTTKPCYDYTGCLPQWQAQPWSSCDTRCQRPFMGLQQRVVQCVYNGTVLSNKLCDNSTKPRLRQECSTNRCRPTWHPSPWSSCSTTCGPGSQSRLVRCIYHNKRNVEQGPESCNATTRPSETRFCNRKPCLDESCVDRSSFCSMAWRFDMCVDYLDRCCATCRDDPRVLKLYQHSSLAG